MSLMSVCVCVCVCVYVCVRVSELSEGRSRKCVKSPQLFDA